MLPFNVLALEFRKIVTVAASFGSRIEIICFGNFWQVAVDGRCPPACPRTSVAGVSLDCPPPRQQYKNTLDVMQRVAQEVVIIIIFSVCVLVINLGYVCPCLYIVDLYRICHVVRHCSFWRFIPGAVVCNIPATRVLFDVLNWFLYAGGIYSIVERTKCFPCNCHTNSKFVHCFIGLCLFLCNGAVQFVSRMCRTVLVMK